ncbi:UDP-N-acetylmuramoylalanine--D-glutamate ligase [Candidatus Falkowbacteria bacterium RIFOXYB2_FULL_34_18]|uniref:UDP-N-acetylmuramoylalanine--D-glutamate ligase n=1 Tax=Candidatus Falkowbacteria bacterium RIFOXYD2_FULL_34_120 TaxID=1798007 RepID=A0A1F5TPC4_9BACT|nr:MAG: UDP-N-acetylmuramoylalanine--D-glutamate ligase [Candidatus Falkowbacteria bacterium RIFOXYB2_FULL_34_18]OGF29065.1 MAG: UDP-N-acetylmuramoylalanine--D-glutamate ligase [Candidatus Falkowbacteria bacterium RIFOXYC12_FULL_34_55]OGF36125.1 MAG: UDP-N-acetylmuramoylalanine--D-glutamate ligase [Candidatus Falkowbacteria bacterium RIFOXYC2_FULL_34_220]OGF38577.1 MAG: UDP-N-acetylmuramoylalanine--D-glutamate ligase [Candidatus Falkowbacteria bacterium RIFOXYD12_FULL_34_57]OGF40750.1 MAG: UDP-
MSINKKLENKKIALLGLGLENYALLKYVNQKNIKCDITICDAYDIKGKYLDLLSVKWQTGKAYDQNLSDFDIVFRSPGYPLFNPNIIKARKRGVKISSAMRLFFDICPSFNIIGVTGSKGKGTTASLIYEIIKLSGQKVFLGGNIGVAPFSFLDNIQRDDFVVLELSSFQLEDMHKSPHIAVLTNLFKEHLAPADPNNPNFHKTMEDYLRAKLNITAYQANDDIFVINKKLHKDIINFGCAERYYFTKSELSSRLIGEHNQENVAAAIEVAKLLDIKPEIIKKAVRNFKGLEHRLEYTGEQNGIKYYNDSFATTPESAMVALRAIGAPVVLLAGGADKGSDFSEFAKVVYKKVKTIILFDGEGSKKIKHDLIKINYPESKIKIAASMERATELAKKYAEKGDVVLLSPGCASFGMFKNYKARGEQFKSLIIHNT